MENKRKALGKGLEQLFNSEPLNIDTLNNYEKEIVETTNKSDIIEIPIKQNGFLISSLLYASYNSIILIPVLTSLREYVTSKKQVIKISTISSLIIIILALLIYSML